jgi:hypothetical protein
MQTSQGYIFCILQHFVTKFCNFADFNKFFRGIYFFLPKSKISLTCRLSIPELGYTCHVLGRVTIFRLLYFFILLYFKLNPNPYSNLNPNANLNPNPNLSLIQTLILTLKV